jgi:hypothetical protein
VNVSAELELVEALKAIRHENDRLRSENARLRETLATYPERLSTTIPSVLAEIRTLVWQLVGQTPPPVPHALSITEQQVLDQRRQREDLFSQQTGIPPEPDARWWPTDAGPQVTVHEETQVQLPEEPEWPREETP